MKVSEIREHFLSRADWVDPEKTVDRVIVGDPDKEVRRVLVTWISSFQACRVAVKRKFDLLVTHEPTFWDHWDYRGNPQDLGKSELATAKKRFIEENGLVILRNHDVWDRFPQFGIPWAWARYLELGDRPTGFGHDGYQHRYDIQPTTLDALAVRVAAKSAALGEPVVQVVGEPERMVSHVGINTGCAGNLEIYEQMGCDVSIVADDGSCYWRDIQKAADNGQALIRVNHGTCEEPGMVTLTRYLNENLHGVTAEHLPHGSCFRLVGLNV